MNEKLGTKKTFARAGNIIDHENILSKSSKDMEEKM